MGVFGTGPGQPISGLPPANRDRQQQKREQPKEQKKDQPHREDDHVELSTPAAPHDKSQPTPGAAPKPSRAHIDLQG